MKKSLWFVLIAAFAALMILAGCPTGGGTDPEPAPDPETPASPGSPGGNGNDDGSKPDSDVPASGYMSAATAGKIFDYTTAGAYVTISGVKDATKLGTYLDGLTPSLGFRAASGGSRTFKLGYIGGKEVAAISNKAFNPVTNGAYDSTKDITLVVGKLELPSSIETLGENLFVGVKATITVDIPAAVITALVEKAKAAGTTNATAVSVVTAIVGEEAKAAVTVTQKDGAAVITGALGLVSVGTPSVTTAGLSVVFTFNKAVTVNSATASAGGNVGVTGSGTTGITIAVAGISGSGGITIAFTATTTATATASSESIPVNETLSYGTSGATAASEVAKSATTNTTTTGLTRAAATKTGNVHRITLKGTVRPEVPSALQADYENDTGFAVITFTGIKPTNVDVRIQQTSPALAIYVGNERNSSISTAQDYGNEAKTQAQVEEAYAADSTKFYLWKTAAPVTYNRLKNYPAATYGSDGDFSVMIGPAASVGEQIATVTTQVTTGDGTDAVMTETIFIIDYTAVIFDVSGTVKLSDTATNTTSGLTVASATRQGSDVSITLAGTGVSTASLPNGMSDSFPGATGCAVITLEGILIASETARIQQANPALAQYVTTLIQNDANNQTYKTTAKTQAEIESAFEDAAAKAYFWQTANPVTYNKLRKYTTPSDGELSILLQPPAASNAITITKIDAKGTTTFHIDYSGVSFVPASGS